MGPGPAHDERHRPAPARPAARANRQIAHDQPPGPAPTGAVYTPGTSRGSSG
ncbi:hypothetical protein GLE_3089 [Lysobacter enzymogenes]|uniref:Uncharacterized protein n=1 Tax=Lysobacter enzymogenes TaxID=69 RepID=A0A0S2DIU5_LYSEN|nr:hypothetical protein GLE_3089 [Lysobacter enzymogenes]